MEDILKLPFGKVITGSIQGPLKTSELYIKSRLATRKYEKENNIIPMKKLWKKTYKSEDISVDLTKEIRNPIIALLQKNMVNTTDIYYDKEENPVMSCSYSMEQKAFRKHTKMICNVISMEAKKHKEYYYLSCEQVHNMITDHTEEFINKISNK